MERVKVLTRAVTERGANMGRVLGRPHLILKNQQMLHDVCKVGFARRYSELDTKDDDDDDEVSAKGKP
jgi:hypothetical protein